MLLRWRGGRCSRVEKRDRERERVSFWRFSSTTATLNFGGGCSRRLCLVHFPLVRSAPKRGPDRSNFDQCTARGVQALQDASPGEVESGIRELAVRKRRKGQERSFWQLLSLVSSSSASSSSFSSSCSTLFRRRSECENFSRLRLSLAVDRLSFHLSRMTVSF